MGCSIHSVNGVQSCGNELSVSHGLLCTTPQVAQQIVPEGARHNQRQRRSNVAQLEDLWHALRTPSFQGNLLYPHVATMRLCCLCWQPKKHIKVVSLSIRPNICIDHELRHDAICLSCSNSKPGQTLGESHFQLEILKGLHSKHLQALWHSSSHWGSQQLGCST